MVNKKDFRFGHYIRGKREEKNYSIRQLSMLSGVSYSYISLLERGLREPPKEETLNKLVRPLNISNQELFDIKERIKKTTEKTNSIIFDLQGLSEEEIESVEKHISKLKEKTDSKDDT